MSFPIREPGFIVVPPELVRSISITIRERILRVRIEETGTLKADCGELSEIPEISFRANSRGNRDGLDVGGD